MRTKRTTWPPAWTLALLLASSMPAIAGAIDPEAFRSAARGLPAPARDAWEATVVLETRSFAGGSQVPRVVTGTGLIVAREAGGRTIWIATSSHVVACPGACLVRVVLPREGGRGHVSSAAELVWRSRRQDLALLRATAPRKAAFRVARAASPPIARTGAQVAAIGFPDLALLPGERRVAGTGREKRFSAGRLLDARADFRAEYFSYGSTEAAGHLDLDRVLTHDAALLPGSSGGPLIDAAGRVLGLNTGSLTARGEGSCAERREACRVHLAVPIGELLEKVEELMVR